MYIEKTDDFKETVTLARLHRVLPDDGPRGTETCRSHIKRYFKIQIVTFYVLINSAFVGKNSFVLIKIHGKTTIKITSNNLFLRFSTGRSFLALWLHFVLRKWGRRP